MSITSLEFALFVAVVVAVDAVLRGPARRLPLVSRPAVRNLWLLAAALYFGLRLSPGLFLVLLAAAGVSFALAMQIEPGKGKRAGLLWAGIAANILALAWFKYTGFFAGPVSQSLAAMGVEIAPEALSIGLPVGLSYLVLQMISYLVDVWRGQLPASRSPFDFLLYAVYFPKVTAGPIERAREFLPRLQERPPLDVAMLERGLGLIVAGLLRKVVIANLLGDTLPNRLFNKPAGEGGPALILVMVGYGVYLLNDFAGYTSIVRGVSALLGIELSPNFLTPYFSRSFAEFWNQWHISLSHWLRDYIYFPVTRALLRHNPNPRWLPNIVVAPLVTMLVSGLWHGATLNLIAWGALHGVYQAVERLIASWRPGVPTDRQPAWRQATSMAIVFVLAIAAWVPFRVPWETLGAFLAELANWSQPPGFSAWRVLIVAIPALLLDYLQYRGKDERVWLRWPKLAQAMALAAALLLIFMSSLEKITPFVYQAF